MAFFMDVSDLINDFGETVTIKVWTPPDEPEQIYPGGPTTEIDLSDDKAEIRHEPVLPLKDDTALTREITAGGGQLEGKLVWYSMGKFPTGTIVEVPDQLGKYKVTSFSTYEPFAHFYEYVLEGDDQHGIEE